MPVQSMLNRSWEKQLFSEVIIAGFELNGRVGFSACQGWMERVLKKVKTRFDCRKKKQDFVCVEASIVRRIFFGPLILVTFGLTWAEVR